ncbi:MAG: bifunctional oligoribonuclease/PAP phosphatase NrnA [Flavobacteriales bacterium]|tara:strand:- start:2727 stop:3734 length:1008 start_codon:yes stop_codon:yes gene_type:complete
MNVAELNVLKEMLSSPKKIVITTHKGPDGDAIGSSLALGNYLIKKGHDVTVITPNEYPKFLKWMKGDKQVIEFCHNIKKASEITNKAEIIFCLDFNTLSRIDTFEPVVSASKAYKALIDHHQQPDTFDFNYSDTNACSTAQMIFEFINAFDDLDYIDRDIAECIYAGILTDTGNFRFKSVTSRTHEVVAHLISKGAQTHLVNDRIYDNNSVSRLKLLGYCLNDKLEVLPEYSSAIINLTHKELDRFNFQKGDTEGVVNYALSIEGISVAAFFVERDGLVKISFRSKGDFSVNQLARDHFNGGGHINAAGGAYGSDINKAIEKFKEILPNYINTNN